MPLISMNRLEEAKAVFDEATAHGLDDLTLRRCRYAIAFLQHDSAGMQEQISWALRKPEAKDWAIQEQGDAAVYRGQFREALGFYSAIRNSSASSAATLADTALREAETGNTVRAKQTADRALTANPTSEVRRELALAFARAGAVKQAEELAKIIDKESPLDTVVQKYELPAIRAAIELHDERPEQAVEIPRSVLPYDLALGPDDSFLPPTYAALRTLNSVRDAKPLPSSRR
jgi:tetratricopeptide (TPR) repeat protein